MWSHSLPQLTTPRVRSLWSQYQCYKIAVAAKDVVEEAELGEKQEEVAGEEEEEEEVVMVVCPSIYTLLLEQATRMFCISLLG